MSLKAESAFAGGVGECGDATVVPVRSAIECDCFHTSGDRALGDSFADGLRGVLIAAGLDFADELLIERRGCGERFAGQVVNELAGYVLVTARDAQARAIWGTANSLANAERTTLT